MTTHLQPEELLRCIDGELSLSGMRRATEHLQSCSSCRGELNGLKEEIAAIFDAEKMIPEPALPPPPNPWPRLEARLDRIAADLG